MKAHGKTIILQGVKNKSIGSTDTLTIEKTTSTFWKPFIFGISTGIIITLASSYFIYMKRSKKTK